MANKKENEVYNKLAHIQRRSDVINLEREYAKNKDWNACAIVANYLSELAKTRNETMKYLERAELYWSRYFSNSDHDTAGNGG